MRADMAPEDRNDDVEPYSVIEDDRRWEGIKRSARFCS